MSLEAAVSVNRKVVLWQQAVKFDNIGGWSHDCQFIDQMGAPYLLATGLGEPVEDAVTTVDVPESGRYWLWVRTKDWFPSHSPGQFAVVVGAQQSDTVFGKAPDDQWHWASGGTFDLDAGETEIRLRDLTGWWGRCDAVVLTSDSDFRPSNGLADLWSQRIAHGAASADLQELVDYDVVVCGGGLAGVAAALSAARHGTRVALLQDRPVLGGNTSSEILVPAMGDETRQPWDPCETGIIEDLDPKVTGRSSWSANLLSAVEAEPNVDLFLNMRTTDVTAEAGAIRFVDAMQTRTLERYRFGAKLFIDCTGDAGIGAGAGADFRMGREARDEYNETLAPPTADERTMGSTLFGGRIEKRDEPTELETPQWTYQWKCPEDFEQRTTAGVWSNGELPGHFLSTERGAGRPPESAMGPVGCWFAEWGGMDDTIENAERVRDELFRICIGMWGYVKNYSPEYRETNRNRKLVWLNHIAGKRESRRLLGDYVLTQRDYAEHIVQPDTVAYGGWTIDDHHPQGYFTPGPSAYHAFLQKVSIPYRSLYSRNVGNLLMAGRNISASHVGFSGVRVMRTCCLMGQAVGTAAAIAVRENTSPRGVYERHLQEFQQTLLADGAYLLQTPNADPSDLARGAAVTASSHAAGSDTTWPTTPVSHWGLSHSMSVRRAVMFRAFTSVAQKVGVNVRSRSREPITVSLALRKATELGNFDNSELVAETTLTIPPMHDGWVEAPLPCELTQGAFYYFDLPKQENLEWQLYSFHPPDTLRGYFGHNGPGWGTLWGCYKFRFEPGGEPRESPYAFNHSTYEFLPQNVINGWSRATDGSPNSWAPNPTLPLPQHVELAFDEPTYCDTLHVSFQLASLAPSHYSIKVKQQGTWNDLLRVAKNRLRRNVHRFDRTPVEGIRLVIERLPARRPSPLCPVCEIRVYDSQDESNAK